MKKAESLSWENILMADGALATEILMKLVETNEEIIANMRKTHAKEVKSLRTKWDEEAGVWQSRYKGLDQTVENLNATTDQLRTDVEDKKPCCSCDYGFNVRYVRGTRNKLPRIELECTKCQARPR